MSITANLYAMLVQRKTLDEEDYVLKIRLARLLQEEARTQTLLSEIHNKALEEGRYRFDDEGNMIIGVTDEIP